MTNTFESNAEAEKQNSAVAEKQSTAFSADDLLKDYRDSVVAVVSKAFQDGRFVGGRTRTGAFIMRANDNGAPNCEIVTDLHVVDSLWDKQPDIELSVLLEDGSKHKASFVKRDQANDLAVLKMEASDSSICKPLKLADKPLKEGD